MSEICNCLLKRQTKQVACSAFFLRELSYKHLRLRFAMQTKHFSLLSHFLPNKPNISLGRYLAFLDYFFLISILLKYFTHSLDSSLPQQPVKQRTSTYLVGQKKHCFTICEASALHLL